jgi:hypothetical protein
MIHKTIDVPHDMVECDEYIDALKHLMGEIHATYPGYRVTIRVTKVRKWRKRS